VATDDRELRLIWARCATPTTITFKVIKGCGGVHLRVLPVQTRWPAQDPSCTATTRRTGLAGARNPAHVMRLLIFVEEADEAVVSFDLVDVGWCAAW
jgi:hypothetical protein